MESDMVDEPGKEAGWWKCKIVFVSLCACVLVIVEQDRGRVMGLC